MFNVHVAWLVLFFYKFWLNILIWEIYPGLDCLIVVLGFVLISPYLLVSLFPLSYPYVFLLFFFYLFKPEDEL